jgi:hypothetical protein
MSLHIDPLPAYRRVAGSWHQAKEIMYQNEQIKLDISIRYLSKRMTQFEIENGRYTGYYQWPARVLKFIRKCCIY